MKFYSYIQNNSGGGYVGPHVLIVEARNAAEANLVAQTHGVYFDGCYRGLDCDCCGDRWHEQWFDEDGFDEPGVYESGNLRENWITGDIVICYFDGSVVTVKGRE